MKRVSVGVRPNWQERLEASGCYYHTIEGTPYWREGVAYEFTAAEIDAIEDATDELHQMCLLHVADEVKKGDYQGYGFGQNICEMIERSWKDRFDHGLYGRFDLAFRDGKIKMFEYNADTPTALPEAAVWQWQWLEDNRLPDQFNSIHEKLVEHWKHVALKDKMIHFTTLADAAYEDAGNLSYLMESAVEAGFDCCMIDLEQIGWAPDYKQFTDMDDRTIDCLFKLYPWEWMMQDQFGWQALDCDTRFVEPPWKMLLSTKELLPQLWAKHKKHPNLLESYFADDLAALQSNTNYWVRKPIHGREGANITMAQGVTNLMFAGKGEHFVEKYDTRYVIQEWFQLSNHDGYYPVIGSWVIGEKAAGIGIREEANWITTNNSMFVPHYFK